MSDFDARARTWDQDQDKLRRAERVAEAIAAQVPDLPERTVLEYGCGTGLLGLALLPRVRRLTLADSSREMLAVAAEKLTLRGAGNAETLYLDLAARIPPPGTRYDLVCSLMTLHHVKDVAGLLARFHGLLSPGGLVALSDLDREDGSFHGAGHEVHHGFDREELRGHLAAAGFGEVRFETVYRIEKGGKGFDLFLATARKG